MKAGIVIILTTLSVFIFSAGTVSASNTKKGKEDNSVWSLIKQKQFQFKVSTVLTTGSERSLKDNSVLSVHDTMFTCYLPNYTGLDFTSNNFDYNVHCKKRECLVSIQNTIQHSDQFLLSVTRDGYGTLKVLHPDGSGITFRGIVMNE